MSSITPFLWFDTQAEEAANYYCSIFKDASITEVHRYNDAGPMPAGTVMTLVIHMGGVRYTFLNGGPNYKLNPAFSLAVICEDQAEVDELWAKLSDGGSAMQCGWLTDKFGLTWQIVPKDFFRLTSLPDRAAASRVMSAMMKMVKIELSELEAAAAG